MAGLTFRVTNAPAVAARLGRYPDAAVARLRDAATQAGNRAFDLAGELFCPVDTGFMLAHLELGGHDDGLSFTLGWTETPFIAAGFAFYPVFQEFGTVHQAPQPTLGPTLQATQPYYITACTAALRDAVTSSSEGAI